MEKIRGIEYNLNQIRILNSKVDEPAFSNFIDKLTKWISTNLGFLICPFSSKELEKIINLYFNGNKEDNIFPENLSMDFQKRRLFSELISKGCQSADLFIPFLSLECLNK